MERRETAEKIFCSGSTVPFIIVRSKRKLQRLKSKCVYSYVWSVRKNPSNENLKYRRGEGNYFHLKCPSLMTDWNQTYKAYRACAVTAMWGTFHERPINGSLNKAEKVFLSPRKVPS